MVPDDVIVSAARPPVMEAPPALTVTAPDEVTESVARPPVMEAPPALIITAPEDVIDDTETAGAPVKFWAKPDVRALAVPVRPVPGPVMAPDDVTEDTEMAGDPVRFWANPEVKAVAVPVRPVPGPLNCVRASIVEAATSVACILVMPVPVL
jgi:hypothetical protein